MTIVSLRGEYDLARRDELDATLDRYGDTEPLALDLRAVERIDTVALRSLVSFQRARLAAGRTPIVLLSPSRTVRNFIEKVEAQRSFEIRDAT